MGYRLIGLFPAGPQPWLKSVQMSRFGQTGLPFWLYVLKVIQCVFYGHWKSESPFFAIATQSTQQKHWSFISKYDDWHSVNLCSLENTSSIVYLSRCICRHSEAKYRVRLIKQFFLYAFIHYYTFLIYQRLIINAFPKSFYICEIFCTAMISFTETLIFLDIHNITFLFVKIWLFPSSFRFHFQLKTCHRRIYKMLPKLELGTGTWSR